MVNTWSRPGADKWRQVDGLAQVLPLVADEADRLGYPRHERSVSDCRQLLGRRSSSAAKDVWIDGPRAPHRLEPGDMRRRRAQEPVEHGVGDVSCAGAVNRSSPASSGPRSVGGLSAAGTRRRSGARAVLPPARSPAGTTDRPRREGRDGGESCRVLATLYPMITEITGSKVVVDSSKHPVGVPPGGPRRHRPPRGASGIRRGSSSRGAGRSSDRRPAMEVRSVHAGAFAA